MGTEKSITDVYELLAETLPDLKAQLAVVENLARSNERALRGTNGESGLVSEVKALLKEQCKIWEKIEEHDTVLYKGKDENEPGLIEQVRDGRRFRKSASRLYWLLIGAILVGLVNILLTFIDIKFPSP